MLNLINYCFDLNCFSLIDVLWYNNMFLLQLLPVILLLITIVLLLASILISGETFDSHKRTTYECGFMPFEERTPILDIQFYIVALSFLLFDLEIALIIPWSVSFAGMTLLGINTMVFFLVFLIVGLMYEWNLRVLDWSNISQG